MKNDVALFGNFEKVAKQADGSLIVDFVATTESVDDQDEVVDYEAAKAASVDYMQWANLREMHQPSAVGTTLTLETNDLLKRITGSAHVVDPTAVMKVESGVYKGVSMGGSKLATQMEKVGGKNVRRITKLNWKELSLVDRPSNPDAYMTIAKMADGDHESAEEPPVSKEETASTADAEETTPAGPEVAAEPAVEAASEEATDKASAPTDIAKGAASELVGIHMSQEQIAWMIEEATAAGKADIVAALKVPLEALTAEEVAIQAELSTPENAAEVAAEEAAFEAVAELPIVFAYAAVTADLAKRAAEMLKSGARNSAGDQQSLNQIHDLSVAAGAYPDDHTGDASGETAGDDAEKMASARDLAKAVATEFAQNAPFAKAADVAAIEERLLKALEPMQEQLSKIAAQPMPGGPLPSFAPAPHWAGSAPQDVTARVSEELSKMADASTNPMLAEELRKQAAAADIRAGWRAPSQQS